MRRPSWVVSARSKHLKGRATGNTKPEVLLRKSLHQRGMRYRLNRYIVGRFKADIAFPTSKVVVMVDGCFWHRHRGCKYAYKPKSKVKFWNRKFTQNIKRQEEVTKQLRKLKWNVLVIWECEVNDHSKINNLIKTVKSL